jgi:cell division protein FtsZ
LVSSRDAARDATAAGYTQPMLTQNSAQAAKPAPRPELDGEPVPQAAEAAENAAIRNGAFISPKPADAGAARPVPLTQPAVPAAAKEAATKPKGRVPSLIERVTGVGRARVTTPPPAPRASAQPVKSAVQPSAQPRLAPLEPDERPNLSKEDDLLDIPAFLRRQAN